MVRGKTRFLTHGLVALALCAGSRARGEGPPPAESQAIGQSFRPPQGALIAPGKAPDAFLLFTGDVLGFVDPCG